METAIQEKRKKVKRVINNKRIEIKEEKATVDKLDVEALAVIPEDLDVMYAGKLCNMLVKMEVSAGNIISGYERKYPGMPEEMKLNLQTQKEAFLDKFSTAKKDLSKVIEKHPLWKKVSGIKGFTAYQLGLVMSYMKDVSRFNSPSALMIYSGIGAVSDNETGRSYPVTKANISKIKEIYSRQGKEFKGFNTALSGRMFTICDCLIRSKGFFYYKYLDMRKRLEERAKTEGGVEWRGEGTEKKAYMVGKNNQSLIMWSERNARRRIARILLHLIWEEWRKLKGLSARESFVQEKLGHTGLVTLDQVLKADAKKPKTDSEKEGE